MNGCIYMQTAKGDVQRDASYQVDQICAIGHAGHAARAATACLQEHTATIIFAPATLIWLLTVAERSALDHIFIYSHKSFYALYHHAIQQVETLPCQEFDESCVSHEVCMGVVISWCSIFVFWVVLYLYMLFTENCLHKKKRCYKSLNILILNIYLISNEMNEKDSNANEVLYILFISWVQ